MYFNESISIKLTVTQQIVTIMFCIGLYLDRRQNTEKIYFFIYTLNYSMASNATILINLILT